MKDEEWPFLSAAAASQEANYISIEQNRMADGESKNLDLLDTSPNPEEIILGRSLYESLSDESKAIINLLWNYPNDLSDITKVMFWKITKPIFKGKPKIKQKVIRELKVFVANLT